MRARQLTPRPPRNVLDAVLAAVQRAAFRTLGIMAVGAVSGVQWGTLPIG